MTDKTWASPGPGFDTIEITNRAGQPVKIGHGICMDINPHEFTAEYSLCEFANYHLEQKVDVILFSSNWTHEGTTYEPEDFKKITSETINYWFDRLYPLIIGKKYPVYFIASDRVGIE